MSNVNKMFPSNFISAGDLEGRDVQVKIGRIEVEEVGGDHKHVVYFQGAKKGMVLNKTNAMNIATMYGPETDSWIGKAITLYPAWVDFQGRSVEAIRVRPVQPSSQGVAPDAPLTSAPDIQDGPAQTGDLDDSIPF